ncbi:hypothetical protein F5B22DRAFT_494153 [Xylaria bambusicola]|uniref:uncharacterized protein n=1 Tax=Xylaria bambusicola TaxID=326684 RepID=UPI0020081586|nr:uncharacterized protein F5B22DRAFT_494153 [Xylaria bambusicola]KAI0505844.1 hypothetical protein F5B22DRAFT_494153 [Xylaria bambusicola]
MYPVVGRTGQAALQIAYHIGSTVYEMGGICGKETILEDKHGISEEPILCGHNTNFPKGFMRMIASRGADVVFNSLSGDILMASGVLVAGYSRIVETDETDIAANSNLPLMPFLRNVLFIDFGLAVWQKGQTG